jgi:hypothetical protein
LDSVWPFTPVNILSKFILTFWVSAAFLLKRLTIVVNCPKYDFDYGVLEISPSLANQFLVFVSEGT